MTYGIGKWARAAVLVAGTLAVGGVSAHSDGARDHRQNERHDAGMMGGQGMMGGHGMMMRGPTILSPYVAGVLELSDEQQERIESIQREGAREHWKLMQALHEHGRALMQLRRQPEPDPEAIGEAHKAWSDAHRAMLQWHARMQRQVRSVLTDEQRQRLDGMASTSDDE